MKTRGVILDHLSVSQLNVDIFVELNKIAESTNDNVCVFYKNMTPLCIETNFGIFGLNAVHNVENGLIIATDLDSAEILIKSQTTAKKVFYVWDLEWIHNHAKRDFLHNVDIYRNIELVTRNYNYALAIKNYCNKMPKISSIREVINVV